MNIAEHIKTQRKKQGLNQEELAERLDVSIKTIQRWEWGKRLPRVDELQKLAGVLGVSVEDLIRQDANDTTPVSLSSTPNSVSTLESIPETSFLVKEKDLIGNGKVLLYEGNGQRFILPATQENQAWFRSLMAGVMTKNIAATAAV
ncbi:MAG: helix-turn-helix transcriptional regulator [Synergistaceae bacterium]|nr:helix-turn-helix transcriptional regulator [Synergistaceae bacterium]